MENLEEFKFRIVFENIRYNLSQRIDKFSPATEIYLGEATSFVDQLLVMLDGMNKNAYQSEAITAFQFLPNFIDIVSNIPEDAKTTFDQERIDWLKSYFTEVKRQIERLKSDPAKFYKEKAASTLTSFFERVRDVYAKNYQVLSHGQHLTFQYA